MRIDNLNEMFRCEHVSCKNFASKEILIGGYKKSISLCTDHYLELFSLMKEAAKKSRDGFKAAAREKVESED
ncbi:MAG: hypothetical protein IJW24_02970 [Clostridia bacterium]|nr:hypothetical protein [Clostridia bacterium]